MCGICGFSWGNEKLIQRMVKKIHHRGPDAYGVKAFSGFSIGNARLSIIDLSAKGNQPMSSRDGKLWIVYNGEIYNFAEIKKELLNKGYQFKSHTDTEVVLKSYQEYGPNCLKKFNGMFAFALWDEREKALYLARDRLGIRPLFYTQHGGRFYFGSEIKALFAEPSILRQIDLKGLDETFTWWTTAPPRTAFMGINELPAASYLKIQNGKYNTKSYWDLEYPETYNRQRSAASWAE